MAGTVALPGQAAYAASKHAVVGFTDGLRREMHPFGVTVVSIEPVRTASLRGSLAAPHGPRARCAHPSSALAALAQVMMRTPIVDDWLAGHQLRQDWAGPSCTVRVTMFASPEADQSTLAPPHPASRPFPAAASDEAKRAYGPTFVDDFMKATATFVNNDLHDPIKVILVRCQRRNRVPGHGRNGRARTH